MHDPINFNYYQRLGVAEDATQEEIKAGHKGMVKQLHPDQRSGPYSSTFDELLKGVNEAYDVLKNPTARQKYDQRLRYERERAADDGRREQEEAKQREQEEREAQEARDRRRREEEERRRREEEAAQGSDDEEWYWSEEGDAAGHEAPRHEPEGRDAVRGAGLMDRVPPTVHRAGLYMTGSLAWLALILVSQSLPIPGAALLGFVLAVGISVLAGVIWLKAGALITVVERVLSKVTVVERVLGKVSTGRGRFTRIWWAQRILESVALGPVLLIVGQMVSILWLLAAMGAMVYVGMWVAEIVQRRGETGGETLDLGR